MKKFLFLALITASLLSLNINKLSAFSFQDAFTSKSGIDTLANKSGYTTDNPQLTTEYYIGLALNMIFSVLGMVLIGLFVYSGIIWMTARGNDSKVQKAKDNLTDALIGLLFIIGAYALSMFLLKIFF